LKLLKLKTQLEINGPHHLPDLAVKKYLKTYKAEVTKHALPARQFNLERSTSVGVPLFPAQQTEAIEIDALKTKAMLWVHCKCRKVYLGKVSFSEAVDVPKRLLIFWQTALCRRKGLRVSVLK